MKNTVHRPLFHPPRLYWLVVMLLTWTLAGTATAQPRPNPTYQKTSIDQRDFQQADWEKLQRQLDYSGDPPEERPARSRRDRPRTSPRETSRFTPPGGFSTLMQIILIGLLAVVIGFLLYRLLGQSDKSPTSFDPTQTEDEGISLERIEEQLDRTDVDYFIQKAEADQAYHLAVRLHYLALLKKLHEGGWVTWKRDNTNREYLRQLRNQPFYQEFQSATTAYERIWYGNHPPDGLRYDELRQRFLQLRQRIASTRPALQPA